MFFNISLGKKNVKAIELFGILKTYFSKIRKYIFLFKIVEMFCLIKQLFLFFSQFSNLIPLRRSFSVLFRDVYFLINKYFTFVFFYQFRDVVRILTRFIQVAIGQQN